MKIANPRLAPYLLIMLAAGIVSASFNNLYLTFSVGILSLLCIIIFHNNKHYKIILIGSITMVIAIIITNLTICSAKPIRYNETLITGRVTEDIEYSPNDTIEFYIDTIQINDKRLRGKAYIKVNAKVLYGNTLNNGDILTFIGSIERIPLNIRDSFSVRKFNRGEYYIADIDSIELREMGRGRLDERARGAIKESLSTYISNPDAAGMAYALLTGKRDNISEPIKKSITDSGIAHIFAVSGMHIAILASFIYLILNRIKISRFLKLFIASIVLLFYGYICGFPPSVVRAIIMSTLVMYGRFSGRRNDLISTLSISAVIILLFSPITIYDLSFLMSYAAVYGIVFLYKPFMRLFTILPRSIRSIVVTSIATNVALFPIMTIYFNSISVYFLLANMLILPLISIIYIYLLISITINIFIPFMSYLLVVAGWAFNGIQAITVWVSALPLATLTIGSMGVFSLFYYGAMIISSDYIILNSKYTVRTLIICNIGIIIGLVIALVHY